MRVKISSMICGTAPGSDGRCTAQATPNGRRRRRGAVARWAPAAACAVLRDAAATPTSDCTCRATCGQGVIAATRQHHGYRHAGRRGGPRAGRARPRAGRGATGVGGWGGGGGRRQVRRVWRERGRCDTSSQPVVRRLRRRQLSPNPPFATVIWPRFVPPGERA